MTNWEQIKEANDLIQTRNLKGKEYAEVKERVIAFRRVNPNGQILTELSYTDNYVNCEAIVLNDNQILAKGHSREYLKTEFAIEKAETSAIGRALGFCGYGIATAIASAEDMESVDKPSEIFDEPPLNELIDTFLSYTTKQEQTDFLNSIHLVDFKKVPSYLYIAMNKYLYEKKHTSR